MECYLPDLYLLAYLFHLSLLTKNPSHIPSGLFERRIQQRRNLSEILRPEKLRESQELEVIEKKFWCLR